VFRPTIVLTGAGGHIGGRLLQYLITKQHSVRPHFRAAGDSSTIWSDLNPTFGDLRNSETCLRICDGADIVVHTATRGYSTSRRETIDSLREERDATLQLARACKQSAARRFIFHSTVRVYGESLIGQVTEETVPQPTDLLGTERFRLETELRGLFSDNRPVLTILRASNSFGIAASPPQTPWDLLIHQLCREAATHGTMTLLTDGRQFRDFIPIGELVQLFEQIIAHPHANDPCYLIASGISRTLNDIRSQLSEYMTTHFGITPRQNYVRVDTPPPPQFSLSLARLRSLGITPSPEWANELHQLVNLSLLVRGST